jgi:hypothetical protein
VLPPPVRVLTGIRMRAPARGSSHAPMTVIPDVGRPRTRNPALFRNPVAASPARTCGGARRRTVQITPAVRNGGVRECVRDPGSRTPSPRDGGLPGRGTAATFRTAVGPLPHGRPDRACPEWTGSEVDGPPPDTRGHSPCGAAPTGFRKGARFLARGRPPSGMTRIGAWRLPGPQPARARIRRTPRGQPPPSHQARFVLNSGGIYPTPFRTGTPVPPRSPQRTGGRAPGRGKGRTRGRFRAAAFNPRKTHWHQ